MLEKGLEHIFDENTKMIILGTFPGIESRNDCYYNNNKNLFWLIVSKCFNNNIPLNGRDERYSCLRKHNIGLWDIISVCAFKGEKSSSLDKRIDKKSIIYNDFGILKEKCPELKWLVFNGKNAQKLFRHYLKTKAAQELRLWLEVRLYPEALPSTSPANTRLSKIDKEMKWHKVLKSI